MKKPLLVILMIGLVPIFLLLIGLLSTKKLDDITTDNYNYPQTDNALLDAQNSKLKMEEFFNTAGKDIGVINLFKDQTIDQLRYDNIYQTSLTVALESISRIKLITLEPFEVDSWTSQDHLYLTSYELALTDNSYSFLGTTGINNKIFLLVNIDSNWLISDILDAPTY
jgi:hypothetical protein